MLEKSAYTWFAQEELNIEYISFETAAHVVKRMWYQAFFETQA